MQNNVLWYLERSVRKNPEQTAVIDENRQLTYRQLRAYSACIGSSLSRFLIPGEPAGIYMEKSADAVCALFGVVFAGGFYSFLNPELPESRLRQIAGVLCPKVILTNQAALAQAEAIFPDCRILAIEHLDKGIPNEESLRAIRRQRIDTDPLYVNFTSGSTGTPKGIVVGHRSVMDFIDCFTEIFDISRQDRIANQAPFDFDVSVKDIYSAVCTGAALVIVPRRLFSAPAELMDFLCRHQVTTLIWAVSALSLLSAFHALEYRTPETVDKILFSGEVMPAKVLRYFRRHLPGARYVNLYGPTEITCNCTYHIVEPEREYEEGIPIGHPFPNEDVFLLNADDGRITQPGEIGEICVRGSALALGYYRADAQNQAHFVRNPLNGRYPETVYRTGDLGKYNAMGELVFCGRKDFQIKYMGHRIELEEIERKMAEIDGVENCCCVFDEKKSRLLGFYVGEIEKETLHTALKNSLPVFMIPGILRRVDAMPLTKNGKIDRRQLAESVGRNRI